MCIGELMARAMLALCRVGLGACLTAGYYAGYWDMTQRRDYWAAAAVIALFCLFIDFIRLCDETPLGARLRLLKHVWRLSRDNAPYKIEVEVRS